MKHSAMGLYGPGRLISTVCFLSLLSMGCGPGERVPLNAKPVVPVNGLVHVDGKPLAGIQIKFHASVQDPKNATLSLAKTDAEGKFRAWTYQQDDGVPPGDYSVTFDDQSQTKPHERSSPDLFKGKYSDPKKSEFKLTVPESGGPIDMGTIELKH